jgi:hypothetical protein
LSSMSSKLRGAAALLLLLLLLLLSAPLVGDEAWLLMPTLCTIKGAAISRRQQPNWRFSIAADSKSNPCMPPPAGDDSMLCDAAAMVAVASWLAAAAATRGAARRSTRVATRHAMARQEMQVRL